MLSNTIMKYYGKNQGFNCAEAMIYAANEEYGLMLDKKALKTMAAFGGGMGVEETCGALTGSLAVLGILFVDDKASESNKIRTLSKEFVESFRQKLNTENCKKLKDMYRKDNGKCDFIVETAAEVLDEIVCREGFRK